MDQYEPIIGVTMPRHGGGIVQYPGVLRCCRCGSLLLEGDEDIHDRLHRPASCNQVHPTMAVHCTQPHSWEEYADAQRPGAA